LLAKQATITQQSIKKYILLSLIGLG
jgi:hypothetical protein